MKRKRSSEGSEGKGRDGKWIYDAQNIDNIVAMLRLARRGLSVDKPFYAPIAMSLIINRTTVLPPFLSDGELGTMLVTDNGRMYFSPYFVLFMSQIENLPALKKDTVPKLVVAATHGELLKDELAPFNAKYLSEIFRKGRIPNDYIVNVNYSIIKTLIEHEVGHLVRLHFRRAQGRIPMKWNISGDLEINSHLHEIPGLLYPHGFDLMEGLSAEQYYELLPDKGNTPYPCNGGSGAGAPKEEENTDGGEGSEGWSEVARERIIKETFNEIIKNRGTAPGDIIRLAEEYLRPKVNWRKILRRLVKTNIYKVSRQRPTKFDFRLPNRRSAAFSPFITPGRITPDISSVAVVVDTSGSISDKELSQSFAEILNIISTAARQIYVIPCDASVKAVYSVRRGQHKKIQFTGGGGTDMRVGIKAALEKKPATIVVLTDGETPYPQEPTPVPLIVGLLCTTRLHGDYKSGLIGRVPRWAHFVEIILD